MIDPVFSVYETCVMPDYGSLCPYFFATCMVHVHGMAPTVNCLVLLDSSVDNITCTIIYVTRTDNPMNFSLLGTEIFFIY